MIAYLFICMCAFVFVFILMNVEMMSPSVFSKQWDCVLTEMSPVSELKNIVLFYVFVDSNEFSIFFENSFKERKKNPLLWIKFFLNKFVVNHLTLHKRHVCSALPEIQRGKTFSEPISFFFLFSLYICDNYEITNESQLTRGEGDFFL